MTLKEAQALTNPFVRCRDGRIGQIVRMMSSILERNSRIIPATTNQPRVKAGST